MRLGILQCDTVRGDLRTEFGDYPDMFRRLLSTAAPALTFRVYDLTADRFPGSPDECDAWLYTGSKWGANDHEDWIRRAEAFAVRLHDERRPTVGICFGHQLIARALGGRVEKASDVGWGVGVHTARVIGRSEWMTPAADNLSLIVSHQDQVVELPPGARLLATRPFCPHDMYQIGDHILTFQGHPEFPKGYSRAVMDRRRDQIGEETYQRGIESLALSTDEAIAAEWITRFLAQSRND
jgi:GMP synthase-like glutamine amidotransferase